MIFALKPTLLLHSGLQSVMFIFHMFCVRTDLFSLSLCMNSFTVSIHDLLSHPRIPEYIYVRANMRAPHTKARACSHASAVNMLAQTCARVHRSIHQPTLYTSTLSLVHNQHTQHNTHEQRSAHNHARTR